VAPGDAQLFQIRDVGTGVVQNFIFQCSRCGGISASVVGESGSAWSRETLTSVKVFDDPHPNGQINMRIMQAPVEMLAYTTLDDGAKEELWSLLLLCGKKLAAIFQHLRRYGEIEDKLIEEAQRRAATQERHIYLEQAQDLLIEFDEFLVQVKSSLDYLVKIPSTLLGRKVWALQTFGDKGEKVIQALENNVPKDKRRIG
jgi:hypothetical protein